MKKLLVSSTHYYQWHRRAGIHYFSDFFIHRGYTCLWITLPYTPLHLFSKAFRSEKLMYAKQFSKGPCKVAENVYNSTCFSLTYPKKGLPEWSYKHFLAFSHIKKHLKMMDFEKPDIFLLESGIGFDLLSYIQPEKTMLRVSDDLDAIHCPPSVLKKETVAINSFTLTTTVNQALKDILVSRGANGDNIALIANGIDVKQFNFPVVIPENKKPVCIYVGVINFHHFDIETIVAAAKENQGIEFHIYGPLTRDIKEKLPGNLHFFGKVPFEQVPDILKNADCGIIPFKDNPRMKTTQRPLKYYQYMASGLPVVFRSIGKLSMLKDSPGTFGYTDTASLQEALRRAVSAGKVLENRKEYRDFAGGCAWENRLDEFESVLKEREIGY
jgi:glycosyltransferase involved in cell wall biosynthesis